jgi:hypothetical protein
MKLTDYMVRSDAESVGIITRFKSYIAANPQMVVVDPFDKVDTPPVTMLTLLLIYHVVWYCR